VPFFGTIKKLFIESEGRFKVAVSISGITLKLLQNNVPQAIKDLSNLAQNGCIEFLSEPWSHSIVAFSDPEALLVQTHRHDEMIRTMFGNTPDIFIVHSPVCSEKIWRTITDSWGKGIFIYSNRIDKAPIKKNDTNKTILSNKGVYLINYILSQALQNMDFNPDNQIRTDFGSLILKKMRNCTALVNPLILVYNPTIFMRPFNQNRAFIWQAIINQLLADPEFHFSFPSELMKTSTHFFNENGVPDKVAHQHKLPEDLWLKNDLQKKALNEQLSIQKLMQTCTRTSLIEDWNLIQDMDHLYYMNNHFFLKEYGENNFNPYFSPYLAFINYMNVLADFTGRLGKKSAPAKHILNPTCS
jgi:alpha-amylase